MVYTIGMWLSGADEEILKIIWWFELQAAKRTLEDLARKYWDALPDTVRKAIDVALKEIEADIAELEAEITEVIPSVKELRRRGLIKGEPRDGAAK